MFNTIPKQSKIASHWVVGKYISHCIGNLYGCPHIGRFSFSQAEFQCHSMYMCIKRNDEAVRLNFLPNAHVNRAVVPNHPAYKHTEPLTRRPLAVIWDSIDVLKVVRNGFYRCFVGLSNNHILHAFKVAVEPP